MKCSATRIGRGHHGSSICGETSPLFPPLLANDAGKARIKALSLNKTALFQQFTVPCNKYMGSKSAFKRHGTHGFHHSCSQHGKAATLTPAVRWDFGTNGIEKLSYCSGVSLSTCSAVVDADESLRNQRLVPEDDTGSALESKTWAAKGQSRVRSEVEEPKKEAPIISLANVEGSSSLAGAKDEAFNLAFKPSSNGLRMCDNGSTIAGRLDPQSVSNRLHQPYFERLEMPEEVGSAAVSQRCTLQSSGCKHIEEIRSLNHVPTKIPCQTKTCKESAADSNTTALRKPGILGQDEVPYLAGKPPISTCGSRDVISLAPLQAIIKPKNVISAVGQQLFWKARKAILRQQETFTNQVFELHKLIEVQRLLAKMPSTLMEDTLPSAKASLGVGSALCPAKENSKKQQVISIKETQQTTPSRSCEVQAHEPKPLQKLTSHHQERETGAELQQTKRRSLASPLTQSLTKGPCGQAPVSSCSEGMSTWGYPIGSINRPFPYPPGSCMFSPGSGVGAVYVAGSGPPMTSFPFPCYAPRFEQEAPCFSFGNQWPSPIYDGSTLTPLCSDWFAGSHHLSQGPLASHSGKPAPTNSATSINMKAEVSSLSGLPAALPLQPRQQQWVGVGNGTAFADDAELAGLTAATASGHVDSIPVPCAIRSCRSETSVLVQEQDKLKETAAQTHLGGQGHPFQQNALNLFPLQPSSSASCARDENGYGRIIKAIPHTASAASESAAAILHSIERERQM